VDFGGIALTFRQVTTILRRVASQKILQHGFLANFRDMSFDANGFCAKKREYSNVMPPCSLSLTTGCGATIPLALINGFPRRRRQPMTESR